MNIISYCDGSFMHICCMSDLHVSHETNVLSWVATAYFRLGLMDRITGKASVGYVLGIKIIHRILLWGFEPYLLVAVFGNSCP